MYGNDCSFNIKVSNCGIGVFKIANYNFSKRISNSMAQSLLHCIQFSCLNLYSCFLLVLVYAELEHRRNLPLHAVQFISNLFILQGNSNKYGFAMQTWARTWVALLLFMGLQQIPLQPKTHFIVVARGLQPVWILDADVFAAKDPFYDVC